MKADCFKLCPNFIMNLFDAASILKNAVWRLCFQKTLYDVALIEKQEGQDGPKSLT